MSESQRSLRHPPELSSPLAWALLGLVIERPSHGYEFAQRFRQAYGGMLPLTYHKNIYKLLAALQGHELIEETLPDAHETGGPSRLPRLYYRATEQGVLAYEEWLLAQLEEERQRQRVFAKQLAMLEPKMALAVIDRYEEECLAEADDSTPAETERESVAHRLATREEQLAIAARISWVRYVRRELAKLLKQQSAADAKANRMSRSEPA